jgi:segregation and condensation protein B
MAQKKDPVMDDHTLNTTPDEPAPQPTLSRLDEQPPATGEVGKSSEAKGKRKKRTKKDPKAQATKAQAADAQAADVEAADALAAYTEAAEAQAEDLPAQPSDDSQIDDAQLAQVVEALLFASDAPLGAGKLAELSGAASPVRVRQLIKTLNDKYESAELSFRIEPIAGGFQMMTLADYQPWLQKLSKQRGRSRLSNAAIETMAIIAYKQPIIRAEIDAIRGVASGDALSRLREMGLIKIVGRAELVGRPMLYGTTRKFLDVFGLANLEQLPTLENFALRAAQDTLVAEDDAGEEPPKQAASA